MIEAGVNKDIELVQTIIYLAGDSPSQYLENREYLMRLNEWFDGFREHEAVKRTHEMILHDRFTYIRTHRAALELHKLLGDVNESYHEWAILVEKFASESRFDDFFTQESDYYRTIVERAADDNLGKWVKWTDDFWRGANERTYLVICMLDGNYGFSVERKGQKENFIIRCLPVFDSMGRESWSEGRLANGIIHEYAHTFVNPVVEAHKDILQKCRDFFAAHTNMISAYNTDYAIMNEYLVRSFTLLFLEQYTFEDVTVEAEISRHLENFPHIKAFVSLLREFQNCTESFEEFYLDRAEAFLLKETVKEN